MHALLNACLRPFTRLYKKIIGSNDWRVNSHCSYCGKKFRDQKAIWPRTCSRCKNISYLNPKPVVVLLVPVGSGLLGIRRDIEPQKGLLALAGGFMDFRRPDTHDNETWQEAAARELREEAGLEISVSDIQLFDVITLRHGIHLTFCTVTKHFDALPPFKPNNEVSELVILNGGENLAFATHAEMMQKYFTRRNPSLF